MNGSGRAARTALATSCGGPADRPRAARAEVEARGGTPARRSVPWGNGPLPYPSGMPSPVRERYRSALAAAAAIVMSVLGNTPITTVSTAATASPSRSSNPLATGGAGSGASRMYM